jgi:small redox-active disulfide protein 2
MDAPIKQILRVGRATVGMVGLDLALNRVIRDRSLDTEQAAEQVYAEIEKKNYIPASAVGDYREAIRKEIAMLRGEKSRSSEELTIRILGHGCVSCNSLQKMAIEIVSELGIAADVFQVHDPDEIGRFGVINSPALVINNDLKCEGRLPSRSEVEAWLRDSLP